MEEADLLIDRPSGGWDELVTKEWLHLELAVVDSRLGGLESRMDSLEARMDSRLGSLESRMESFEHALRAQTWKMIAAMTGLLGALVAAIKL